MEQNDLQKGHFIKSLVLFWVIDQGAWERGLNKLQYPYGIEHGLRTPNEGINQRNMEIWAMWHTKYTSAVPKNLGVGVDFRPCSESDFLTGHSWSVEWSMTLLLSSMISVLCSVIFIIQSCDKISLSGTWTEIMNTGLASQSGDRNPTLPIAII